MISISAAERKYSQSLYLLPSLSVKLNFYVSMLIMPTFSMISTFDLTLSNPVVAPKHLGGCASWYRMATEPPCMPALTRWTTRQDVVVISLREALNGKQEKKEMIKCMYYFDYFK